MVSFFFLFYGPDILLNWTMACFIVTEQKLQKATDKLQDIAKTRLHTRPISHLA